MCPRPRWRRLKCVEKKWPRDDDLRIAHAIDLEVDDLQKIIDVFVVVDAITDWANAPAGISLGERTSSRTLFSVAIGSVTPRCIVRPLLPTRILIQLPPSPRIPRYQLLDTLFGWKRIGAGAFW